MIKKVELNFGHGGKDPGATANNLKEKDLNLEIGLKVGKILERHKVEVSYTRTTDEFISLSDIAKIANNRKVDIFVSLHINAGSLAANGVETFSHPDSSKGAILSKDIQNQLVSDKIFKTNRGTKTANFAVLRLTEMPAALVELGFITNPHDSNILKIDAKKDEIALSLAKGILKNLGIEYIYDTEVEVEKVEAIKLSIHGKEKSVDGIVKDNTSYIPVRLLEDLGYKIGWENGKVTIEYK